jgi:hypothetical protein
MIISYKHRFIFWKTHKSAGSSVLQALGKHCGPDDVVGQPRQLEGYQGYGRNMLGLGNHSRPHIIRRHVTEEVWKTFFKFTIVRNPWDVYVSQYWFKKKRGRNLHAPRPLFKKFLLSCPSTYINLDYIFARDGELVADFYIRYEQLQADFDSVCGRLGVPIERLPRLKCGHRKSDKPYWEYYDKWGRQLVFDKCEKVITHFGYQFKPI